MSKKGKIICIIIIACILIGLTTFLFYPYDFNWNGRSEGVKSLTIHFEEESINTTFTQLTETLEASGYSPYITHVIDIESNETIWHLRINWTIPDEEYAENYASNLTVVLYGFEQNNSIMLSSPMVVYYEWATLVNDSAKKEMDKNLTKQAAFEIADIINVTLDWDRHEYLISWTTMTSDGQYIEQ